MGYRKRVDKRSGRIVYTKSFRMKNGLFYRGAVDPDCGFPDGYGRIRLGRRGVYEGIFSAGELVAEEGGGKGRMRKSRPDTTLPDPKPVLIARGYRGELSAFSGKGKIIYPALDLYEGEIKDGVPSGKGVCLSPTGDKYEGELLDGSYHGKGRLSSTGFLYEGDFVMGEKSGKGRLFLGKRLVYEGEFSEGRYHGCGTLYPEYGEPVTGRFENGEQVENPE